MTDGASPAPAEGEVLSIYEAASLLGKRREEGPKETAGEDVAQRAPAAPEPSGDDPEAVETETSPDETAVATDDAASEPPIDPPRTWPKAQKEIFATLPRETQLKLVEIESARDREIQKGLKANAEREKTLEAERQAIKAQQQQYETTLPQLAQLLSAQHASEFGDIKTLADAEAMLKKDPPRYMRWQLSQQKIAAARAEAQKLNASKQAEARKWFDSFVAEQDAKFLEAAPEYADPEKVQKLQAANIETLTEIGFSQAELEELMLGRKPLLARDHRVQLLVRDATKWRQAQKAAAAAKAKPTPPVTRPGVAPDKGASKVASLKEAQQKLARTGKAEDAVALLRAKRAS